MGLASDTETGTLPGGKFWAREVELPIIISEVIRGKTVFDWLRVIRPGSMSEKEISKLFGKITEALISVHNRDLIVLDMKLDNLMFTDQSSHEGGIKTVDSVGIKIVDLGLAVQLMNRQYHFDECRHGNRINWAPEVLPGPDWACYSRASDIWQLGCILYTLLFGQYPFQDPSNSAFLPLSALEAYTVANIKAGITRRDFFNPYLDCPSLSIPARDLLTKLLSPDPLTRITGPEVFRISHRMQSYVFL